MSEAVVQQQGGWSRWRLSVTIFAAAVAGLLALFWETASSMERIWATTDSYQHTYLVPFILAYLVWEDRDRLAAALPRPDWRGLAVILLASAGWLVGWAAQVQAVQQLALVGMVQGLVLALFGWAVLRLLLFPVLFLVFLVPMGDFMVPVLQRWTADFVVWSVKLTGIPTATDGFMITLQDGSQPWHRFHVARECSGIRYLTAMFQIGLLTAYLLFRSWPRRIAAVLVALAVPILANWLRAFGIVLIAYHSQGTRGMDVDHIIYGFWFFLFVLAIYIGVCWLFAEPPLPRRAPHFPDQAAPSRFRQRLLATGALAVLAAATGPLYAMALGQGPDTAPAALQAPGQVDGWRRTAYLGMDWRPRFIGADGEVLARYTRGADTIDLYVARYDRQRQGAELINYRNDLAGHGWDDLGERLPATLEVDGAPVTVRYVRLAQPDRRRMVFYWYWVNGSLVSSDMMAKLQMTSARLFGGPAASAVIAVAADDDGDLSAVTATVRGFVAALSPVSLLQPEAP